MLYAFWSEMAKSVQIPVGEKIMDWRSTRTVHDDNIDAPTHSLSTKEKLYVSAYNIEKLGGPGDNPRAHEPVTCLKVMWNKKRGEILYKNFLFSFFRSLSSWLPSTLYLLLFLKVNHYSI